MSQALATATLTLAAAGGLSACGQATGSAVSRGGAEAPFAPGYLGLETRLLDGDLVSFATRMTGARDNSDVQRYGECAAAQYALIRGYGFARHVRTNVDRNGEVWTGDSVFLISESLPEGVRTIDAEVVVQDCRENGIPTV